MSLLRRIRASVAQAAAVPEAERFKPARIARLAAEVIERQDRFEQHYGKNAVKGSPDLERILALPRRSVPDEATLSHLVVEMTARLSNGVPKGQGCSCHKLNPAAFTGAPGSACITELRGVQAWYLAEAEQVQGCLGAIAVGAGKTALDVLTAMVVPGCKEAVLLLPPTLKPQFLVDLERWRQHFTVPNIAGGRGPFVPGRPVLHVLKYSELSAPRFSSWLADRPNITVVIADEAHALKARNAVRVGRFLNYFIDHPETRFFCHTGTLTSKGLEDFSHLSALALREGSPVPIEPHVVTTWGEALNPTRNADPAPPGALLQLCKPNETVRSGFHRRFVETAGVVATSEGSLAGVALKFSVRKPPPMPAVVQTALREVRTTMQRPDHEELTDALEVARVAREVACGFFHYWNYPGAQPADFEEPDGKIPVWFRRRQAWNREVRNRLARHTQEMDSPKLLRDAAQRHLDVYRGEKPTWASETFAEWVAVEKTVSHETKTKWLSDWLAQDAAAWALETEAQGWPGIVWTQNPELGHLVAKLAGRPYYGAGDDAAVAIDAERGDRSVVASIPAHHRGRNLQYAFAANLLVQPPSSADICEQLCGRTHRSGQRRDEVRVYVYQHVPEFVEAFEVALGRSEYAKQLIGADQKVLAADLGRFDFGLLVSR